jgi:predicted nucleic acid-binding protein
MAGFGGRIGGHQVAGIDTVTFIYHFERHPQYFRLTQPFFRSVLSGELRAVTSMITLTEIVVLPLRQGLVNVARSYESAIAHYPHLRVAPITRRTARIAGNLRADHRLLAPDALQVAAAIQYGATAFVTNDKQMRRLSGLLDIVVLDDFL